MRMRKRWRNLTANNTDSFTYGKGNRLTGYNGETLTYDADGNMTYGPLGDKFANFRFDALNRLAIAGDTVYTYDGENNRVSDGKTTFVNDTNSGLSNLLMTANADSTNTIYVYGIGLISQETGTDYRLFHYDYRGSTTALTDASGKNTDMYSYSAYGQMETHIGDSVCIFLFVGKYGVQTDSNGLYFMRARYYSPELGRFINEDPIRDGLNWYGYCDGNPIVGIDPSGYYVSDWERENFSSNGVLLLDLMTKAYANAQAKGNTDMMKKLAAKGVEIRKYEYIQLGVSGPPAAPVTPVVPVPSQPMPVSNYYYPVDTSKATGTGDGHPYKAIDIFAPSGTPVFAFTGGKVISNGKIDSYGETSVVIFGDDDYIYYYTHLTAGSVPISGSVKAGNQIGTVGPTGMGTGYPHLHFDITKSVAKGGKYNYRATMSRDKFDPTYALSFVSPQERFIEIWGTELPR